MTVQHSEFKPVSIIDYQRDRAIPAELEWVDSARLPHVLNHMMNFRADEAVLREWQQGIVRDGRFLLPSPLDDGVDACVESWFHEFQIYYKFVGRSGEIYIWITGLLDRAYSLETLWFPDRDTAFTLYASQIDNDRIQRFATAYPFRQAKSDFEGFKGYGSSCAIFGFPHFMHTLWNELPAILDMARKPRPLPFTLGIMLEPFGPMRVLCPALADCMIDVSAADMVELNRTYAIFVGLGSQSIDRPVQDTIRQISNDFVPLQGRSEVEAFRQSHESLFWISVKPPKRTLLDQEQFIADLIRGLSCAFPGSGFILNGASRPWDLLTSRNYESWFLDRNTSAVADSQAIIDDILNNLSARLRDDIKTLNDITVSEELIWANHSDFYICHGGTMQNKIGWTTMVPGVTHSSTDFLAAIAYTKPPVGEAGTFLIDPSEIEDDHQGKYSDLEIARKDRNYRFSDPHRTIKKIVSIYSGIADKKTSGTSPINNRSTDEGAAG